MGPVEALLPIALQAQLEMLAYSGITHFFVLTLSAEQFP